MGFVSDWRYDRALLRRIAALALWAAWLASFFTRCGWGWHDTHWALPSSQHFWITFAATGLPVLLIGGLAWPGLKRISWMLWGMLGVLLAAEVALRALPPPQAEQISLLPGESTLTARLHEPHHYTLFQPIPNIHTPDGLIHNRFGFRDARALEPDPKAIRLVFIGDSTVYGAATPDNRQLFTHHLEERLNTDYRQELGARHFEVVNAGMNNATSAETLLRLIFAVSEVKPDLVAIQLGISDTWPRVASDAYFGDFRQLRKPYSHGRTWQPRLSVADALARTLVYRSALLDYLLGARIPGEPLLEMTNRNNAGKIERLETNPPIYYERNLRYMLALIHTMGALPVLVADPIPVGPKEDGLYQRSVPEHNGIMAKLAESEGVPFFDLGNALPLTPDIRVEDKFLNVEGQRRQADILFDWLRSQGLLTKLLAGTPGSRH